ncbi:teichoic acid biosynthesis protein [Lujinxingia litoralis]|uniref:Teichoic acid biosynthesis protein n=1 Tax=Lujinxingia litoralis TaxID=2211119 RepID=A0A328C5W7_9DELT|nr:MJ1255/VC2487 family glycosyltransferase [Lujinxingia litoralis]RAL20400.1 teichoic acid biosynthesis protein [Lujinxingia litoralis]
MKILYGVVGEGMGHAIRSAVVLKWLLDQGHQVQVVASGRAHAYLKSRVPRVDQIWGLTMAMEHNQVRRLATATDNLRGALEGWPSNVRRYFEMVGRFSPDVVISDFETWSWLFAKVHRIPLICIDNIQLINRCWHDDAIIGQEMDEFLLAKSIVKAKCPRAAHYVITSFCEPPVRKKRTSLVPPILRPEILNATPTHGEHLLVYQTSPTFSDLPRLLAGLQRPVYIYGLRREIQEDQRQGNLVFRPFSETQFVEDLASAAGVIASAGFTLMGEALHLRKPFLATPVGGQFEQLLNARYLHELGYGTYSRSLGPNDLVDFVDELPRYRQALQSYEPRDNSALFARLEELFDLAESGILRSRRVRWLGWGDAAK